MKSNEELVGELCKQTAIDGPTAFAVLDRKDAEMAKEKELLKQELLWHLTNGSEGIKVHEGVKQKINDIVDKHFPQGC